MNKAMDFYDRMFVTLISVVLLMTGCSVPFPF